MNFSNLAELIAYCRICPSCNKERKVKYSIPLYREDDHSFSKIEESDNKLILEILDVNDQFVFEIDKLNNNFIFNKKNVKLNFYFSLYSNCYHKNNDAFTTNTKDICLNVQTNCIENFTIDTDFYTFCSREGDYEISQYYPDQTSIALWQDFVNEDGPVYDIVKEIHMPYIEFDLSDRAALISKIDTMFFYA